MSPPEDGAEWDSGWDWDTTARRTRSAPAALRRRRRRPASAAQRQQAQPGVGPEPAPPTASADPRPGRRGSKSEDGQARRHALPAAPPAARPPPPPRKQRQRAASPGATPPPGAPDPRRGPEDCLEWLRWWASPRQLQWATQYFASRDDWGRGDFVACQTDRGEPFVLGEGGDGIVSAAVERTHCIPVALKETGSDNGEREVFIHATLDNPAVVRYFTDFWDEEGEAVVAVIELCAGGTLFDALPDEGGVAEGDARAIVAAVCGALAYLQSVSVIYADLKTTNLFITALGELRLGDFGASHFAAKRSRRKLRQGRATGTVSTQAPEVVRGELAAEAAAEAGERRRPAPAGFDRTVDNWALGVLIYRLLVGGYPFDGGGGDPPGDADGQQQRQQQPDGGRSGEDDTGTDSDTVRRNILDLRYTIPGSVPAAAAELIRGLLKRDAGHRLPLSEVRRRPWVRGAPEECALLLRGAAAGAAGLARRMRVPICGGPSGAARRGAAPGWLEWWVGLYYEGVPMTRRSFEAMALAMFLLGVVSVLHLQGALAHPCPPPASS